MVNGFYFSKANKTGCGEEQSPNSRFWMRKMTDDKRNRAGILNATNVFVCVFDVQLYRADCRSDRTMMIVFTITDNLLSQLI